MCNQEFSNLLSTLSSFYISNFSIMQQIACITMYFATIDEWTSYSGVLDLVKNLISYTHNFCNSFSINPNNKMTVSNRMYPLFSIFQNMSQNRCYMYLAWSIGRGMDKQCIHFLVGLKMTQVLQMRVVEFSFDSLWMVYVELDSDSREWLPTNVRRRRYWLASHSL